MRFTTFLVAAAFCTASVASCIEPAEEEGDEYEWYDEDADKSLGLPSWLELRGLAVWVHVPADTWLYKSFVVDVYTTMQTKIGFTATNKTLTVDAALYIDVLGPKNEQLHDVTYEFATGKVTVRFLSSEWGGLNWQTTIKNEMQTVMTEAVAGTRMAQKGYDPTLDPNIGETLSVIASRFLGGSTTGAEAPFDYEDAEQLGVQATFYLKEDKDINESGQEGIRLLADHYIQIESDNQFRWPEGSNLQAVLDAATPSEFIKAFGIEAINIRSYQADEDGYKLPDTGILVVSKGKGVALLQDVTVDGDTLTLNKWFLTGRSLNAAITEKALLGLLFGRDPKTAEVRATKNGGIVRGFVAAKLEDGLSVAIRRLIYKHRAVVPGIDLPRALRMTPPPN